MCGSQVIPAWLGCLPIKDDKIEAKVVHDQLCSMVERYLLSYLNIAASLVFFLQFI
jgi:hypothetical protein